MCLVKSSLTNTEWKFVIELILGSVFQTLCSPLQVLLALERIEQDEELTHEVLYIFRLHLLQIVTITNFFLFYLHSKYLH